jgi:opacity protein-like surface antigen
MKRLTVTLFAIVLLFSMSSLASAQGLTGYGIKAGLNLANISEDWSDDWEGVEKKMKTGFSVGGFITYSINEMFAIQPEALYTMKGAKWEWADEGWQDEEKLAYLEIPVLAKFTIPTQGNIAPNLFVGPALGILLSAKYYEEWDSESEERDIKDDMKSTDFGLAFGAGVEIGMPHSAITIDGRYTLGLTNTCEPYTDPETGEETECDEKNGVISFMVGYSF